MANILRILWNRLSDSFQRRRDVNQIQKSKRSSCRFSQILRLSSCCSLQEISQRVFIPLCHIHSQLSFSIEFVKRNLMPHVSQIWLQILLVKINKYFENQSLNSTWDIRKIGKSCFSGLSSYTWCNTVDACQQIPKSMKIVVWNIEPWIDWELIYRREWSWEHFVFLLAI